MNKYIVTNKTNAQKAFRISGGFHVVGPGETADIMTPYELKGDGVILAPDYTDVSDEVLENEEVVDAPKKRGRPRKS